MLTPTPSLFPSFPPPPSPYSNPPTATSTFFLIRTGASGVRFRVSFDPEEQKALDEHWTTLHQKIKRLVAEKFSLQASDLDISSVDFLTGIATIKCGTARDSQGVEIPIEKLWLITVPENPEEEFLMQAFEGIRTLIRVGKYSNSVLPLHKKGVVGNTEDAPSPFTLRPNLSFQTIPTGGRKWEEREFGKNLNRFQMLFPNVSDRIRLEQKAKVVAFALRKLTAIVEAKKRTQEVAKTTIDDVEEEEIQKFAKKISTFNRPLERLKELDPLAAAWALANKPFVNTELSSEKQIHAGLMWIRTKRKELATALGFDLQHWGVGVLQQLMGQTEESKLAMVYYFDNVNLLGITDPSLHALLAVKLKMKEIKNIAEPPAGGERFVAELGRQLDANPNQVVEEALQDASGKVYPYIDCLLDPLEKEDRQAIKERFLCVPKANTVGASASTSSSSSSSPPSAPTVKLAGDPPTS